MRIEKGKLRTDFNAGNYLLAVVLVWAVIGCSIYVLSHHVAPQADAMMEARK